VSDEVDTRTGWLSGDEIDTMRARMPIVYVEAVPVRLDSEGTITHVGLLLRAMPDGSISRAIVSGRVLYNERVRECLVRNLEKDLGPVALPRIPPHPAPFTVAEYFQNPAISGFHDPRQHAVSLVYLVPIDGDCQPSQDALDLAWLTPEEVIRDDIRVEMTSGHDRLVRMALAHAGCLF
jgi:ADP-ribose pyrophosphatase YjhB (NUDIX family)